MYEDLKRLKDDYIREILDLYHEKGVTKDTIPLMDTMVHTTKNICKVLEECEKEEMMYSERPYGPYSMNYSYARGRGANANRDSMGRYSSTGYSGHHDLVNGLYDLMNRTSDEGSRHELQDMINRIESK